MSRFLKNKIEFLKGVGPQKADLLTRDLGITTFNDLIHHYPYRYIDRTKIYKISEVTPETQYIQLKGVLDNFIPQGKGKGARLTAQFTDETGSIELVWFRGLNWITKLLQPGNTYMLFGKPSIFNRKINIVHPEIETLEEHSMASTYIQPMYNTSERMKKRSMDSKAIQKLTRALLDDREFEIWENLPSSLVKKLQLMDREQALRTIHYPKDFKELEKAQTRLKFEELFYIQLKMLKLKSNRNVSFKGMVFGTVGEHFNEFFNNKLPFELTDAQKRVVKEIRADMNTGKQMNRLLQGDVGSGKTVVALMCMLIALDNGTQAALMAPTEILATQHYSNLVNLTAGMDINIRLLTGSTPAAEKREIYAELTEGNIDVLVGTHALIEDKVQFKKLGLVVIDEQHRFGVAQRAKLWAKEEIKPHVLVMTATPIPRTLAMTVYGDLDYSVIDELPKGRKEIKTAHRFENQRLKVFNFIKEQLDKGQQAYIVYPLIAESEKLDYQNLMEGYDHVADFFEPLGFKLGIVHGKMKASEKEAEMQKFKDKKTHILVATTVIEVGIDVPNANIMVIESTERFGLSQLHQLRGRVGRGSAQSYCILLSSYKLSNEGRIRIDTMVRTNDGFEIAEVDLKLRGPGDLEGTQQSGILDLKLADITKDSQLLNLSRIAAQQIVDTDPELQLPGNKPIANYLSKSTREKFWSRVS